MDGVRYLHFDITDSNPVKKYLGEDYDFVVNLGGYIDHQFFRDGGRDLIDAHFTASQNLLEVLPATISNALYRLAAVMNMVMLQLPNMKH